MSDAKIIDGRAYAANLREKTRQKVKSLHEKYGITPGLAVVLVGDDPASAVYVRNKNRFALECGIASFEDRFHSELSEAMLLRKIEELNADSKVHGILVQLPLPKQISSVKVINRISPAKDVDGFHQINAGLLFTDQINYSTSLLPCTPKGCLLLIKSVLGENLVGKNAIVIGASNIVGRPMAAMLLNEKCTVTIAHSKTKDLAGEVARADIVVIATGVVGLLKGSMLKKGAVVIDVGINKIYATDGKERIIGDAEWESCHAAASRITPVPGGVGPMTIACLLENTVIAACNQHNINYSDV